MLTRLDRLPVPRSSRSPASAGTYTCSKKPGAASGSSGGCGSMDLRYIVYVPRFSETGSAEDRKIRSSRERSGGREARTGDREAGQPRAERPSRLHERSGEAQARPACLGRPRWGSGRPLLPGLSTHHGGMAVRPKLLDDLGGGVAHGEVLPVGMCSSFISPAWCSGRKSPSVVTRVASAAIVTAAIQISLSLSLIPLLTV